MTTATIPSPAVATGTAADTGASPQRPRRRWVRIVIPVGVVAVLWIVALAAHYYQDVDRTDPGALSPIGTGRHGSSQLAQLLDERDITIERVTSTAAAIEAARGQAATILVPAPDLLNGALVPALAAAPGTHRVVMVQPGLLGLFGSGLPVGITKTRWASKIVEPECDAEVARQAGAAGVYRIRYVGFDLALYCYGGSVVGGPVSDVEVLLVGATDPFRNDRIGEAGNAALATGLLDRHPVVIWVDVHESELRVPLVFPEYQRPEIDRTSTGNPTVDAFPVQLWTVLALLTGAAVLFAVARARRLGPPVPEPLPVVVPAAETVTGRGRLYRRIGARGASLTTLRGAALGRLAPVVGSRDAPPDGRPPDSGAQREALIRTISARAKLPEATVVAILFGPVPTDDAGLVAAAADLDRLVAAVLAPPTPAPPTHTPQPRPPEPGGSP